MSGTTRPRRLPNEFLRQARLRLASPSGSGRAMSRQELADLVNRYLTRCGIRTAMDEGYIGKLERGEHRWPGVAYREALRLVLGVRSDAELGLFIVRAQPHTPTIHQARPAEVCARCGHAT